MAKSSTRRAVPAVGGVATPRAPCHHSAPCYVVAITTVPHSPAWCGSAPFCLRLACLEVAVAPVIPHQYFSPSSYNPTVDDSACSQVPWGATQDHASPHESPPSRGEPRWIVGPRCWYQCSSVPSGLDTVSMAGSKPKSYHCSRVSRSASTPISSPMGMPW